MLVFFFFKQKTAYDMRISDWSSDVCSSDLRGPGGHLPPEPAPLPPQRPPARAGAAAPAHRRAAAAGGADVEEGDPRDQPRAQQLAGADRLARALRRGAAAPRPARAPADREIGTAQGRERMCNSGYST